MFIIKPIKASEAEGELALIYKKIQKTLGFIPPHFELFGTIDSKSLKNFIEYNLYFQKHPKVDAKVLPFLRLCIAQKECRKYCINFNTNILKKLNVDIKVISNICNNLSKLPLDTNQILLLSKVIYAIYNPDKFNNDDLQELFDAGFSNKDFFELLNYATDFMAKSKMIEIYMK